jgi:hypothetical protein
MSIPPDFHGAATRLTVADVDAVAGALGVESRAIWAVASIEAADSGFLPDGRPEILFESHQFSKRTGGQWDGSHPDVSQASWVHDYGKGGAHQYERLNGALELDRDAALQSTSWGMFQIMGFNSAAAGFASVEEFIAAMCESEGRQLDAFAAYCTSEKLVEMLRNHDWLNFALRYNGPGQAENNYAEKLAAAYADGNFPPPGVPAGPAPAPQPAPPGPAPGIRIALGDQCSFPVVGEDIHGAAMAVPAGALSSGDEGICTVTIGPGPDQRATVAGLALGKTTVGGPELEIPVSVVPGLARVRADLSKLVFSRIGAAVVARLPLVAGVAALVVALALPSTRPDIGLEPPREQPQPVVFAPLPRAAELPAPAPALFAGSTFCLGPGLRVIPLAACRR